MEAKCTTTEPKIHAGQIEVAVANLLNYRIYTIVPNVSWGLGLRHECDMLALDKQNRFTEIEIKISSQDLKADFNKKHGHKSKIISRLIYAMPESLCEKHQDLIPNNYGIIAIRPVFYEGRFHNFKAYWFRQCKHDKTKEKPNENTIRKFMELGCMRIWSLKQHNNKIK